MNLIVCAVLGASAFFSSEASYAEARFSESFNQLRADMRFASNNPSRGLTILHRWAREHRVSPSFIPVGHMEPHELVSGRRFADFIYDRYKLTLVLVAKYEDYTVPGFDGVVVDQNLKPVANISLKTLIRPHLPILYRRSEKGFEMMENFSDPERWIHHVSAKRSTTITNNKDSEDIEFRFHREESREIYRHDRDCALDLVAVLAPGTGRPNWLVVDIGSSENLSRKDYRDFATLTRKGENRQAVLLTEGEAVTVFDGHSEKAPLPKKCQKLLGAG